MRRRREFRNDVMWDAFASINTADIPEGHRAVGAITRALRRFRPSRFGGWRVNRG